MKEIEASYEILTPITGQELQMIERVGRVCYISEDKITEDGKSAERFVSNLIRRGHESVLEHYSLSVLFTVDRALSHELVRHRVASYAQESQRYCNYSNDKFGAEITFIRPWWLHEGDDGYKEWKQACQYSEQKYLELMNAGWKPETARGVLPNAVRTRIVMSANLREWRHVLKLRTDASAHPDMVRIMRKLLKEFQEKIPIIFDDIV